MAEKLVWLVTGAGRGLGVDLVRAALGAGHAVVATGRDVERLREVLGEHDRMHLERLDITDESSARDAVDGAVERFGRVDVLVNNAGNFFAGFFETFTPEQFRAQIETNFFGPVNVTRAVLPVLRAQRSGHIVTISSLAGIVGHEFNSAYAASKFALEGWAEALAEEVAPFGIGTTIVNPGFFRTELLVDELSTTWADITIDDYRERGESTIAAWKQVNGKQSGDPAKLAEALVQVLALPEPPLRWVAGADAVEGVVAQAELLRQQATAHLELSTGLDHD